MNKCIVVAGMHRSGTSLITKSLESLGVSLGNNLMPCAEQNIKGFWEDLEVVNINDRILKLADMDWASINRFPTELIDSPKGILLQKEAKKIVSERITENPVWGVKDPRLTRLLPFWQKIFFDLQIAAHYIYVIRNPLDIANSLKSRDDFDLSMSIQLWLLYTFESLTHLTGEKIYFVSYDTFLTEPEKYLREIAAGFELDLDAEKLSFFKNEFIDIKLRHSHSSDDDLTRHSEVPSVIKKMFLFLKKLTDNKADMQEVTAILRELEYGYLIFTASTVHKFSRNGHILDIELKNTLKLHKSLISQHEALQNYRLNLEAEIQNLQADIQKLHTEKSCLEQKFNDTNDHLQQIYKTKTWRLTKPIRSLRAFFLKNRFLHP
jgi:hypothetical protein